MLTDFFRVIGGIALFLGGVILLALITLAVLAIKYADRLPKEER